MRIWSILLLHLVEKIQADEKDILMQNSGQLGEIGMQCNGSIYLYFDFFCLS